MGASTRSIRSRRFATLLGLGVILGLTASCGNIANSPSNDSLPGGPGSVSPQAEVFFCETQAVECRTTASDFDITKLRDLFVFVSWRGVTGEHTQELRLLLPDGNLYQTITARFTTAPIALSPEVQVAKDSRGEPTVVSVLPVAGTFITQHFLVGTWTVEVILDGQSITRVSFTLRPPQQ